MHTHRTYVCLYELRREKMSRVYMFRNCTYVNYEHGGDVGENRK